MLAFFFSFLFFKAKKRMEEEEEDNQAQKRKQSSKEGGTSKRIKGQQVTDELATTSARRCPYLDTVNRALLDFDFEKVCSVSSTNINVYACLTCGKYFQGHLPSTCAKEPTTQHMTEEIPCVYPCRQGSWLACLLPQPPGRPSRFH